MVKGAAAAISVADKPRCSRFVDDGFLCFEASDPPPLDCCGGGTDADARGARGRSRATRVNKDTQQHSDPPPPPEKLNRDSAATPGADDGTASAAGALERRRATPHTHKKDGGDRSAPF